MSDKSIADQCWTNKPDSDIVAHASEHVGIRVVGVLDGHLWHIVDLRLTIFDSTDAASRGIANNK
jgi:hypothetical protein